jgi:tRNA (guanosine-2'-O-)-methyltransferase
MNERKALEPFLLSDRIARIEKNAELRTRNLVVVLDDVHDPHNQSAIVRSCDGFGLLELHVIENHPRFRCNKKVSQGAQKWLEIMRHRDSTSCATALNERGFELWVADPKAPSQPVDNLPWERPLALVFGNEHEGPSKAMRSHATGCFHVPMFGFVESFNVSVAVGIALAVGVRERLRRLGRHGDLTDEERQQLIAAWVRRSVRHADKILSQLTKASKATNSSVTDPD